MMIFVTIGTLLQNAQTKNFYTRNQSQNRDETPGLTIVLSTLSKVPFFFGKKTKFVELAFLDGIHSFLCYSTTKIKNKTPKPKQKQRGKNTQHGLLFLLYNIINIILR